MDIYNQDRVYYVFSSHLTSHWAFGTSLWFYQKSPKLVTQSSQWQGCVLLEHFEHLVLFMSLHNKPENV